MNAFSSLRRGTRLAISLTVLLVLTCSGCRICCDVEDAAYPAYGGAWERTVRNNGRVGSLFSPAGAQSARLTPKEEVDSQKAADRFRDQFDESAFETEDPKDGELPKPKSELESEEEFQERKRRLEEEMLNASVILGAPRPPAL